MLSPFFTLRSRALALLTALLATAALVSCGGGGGGAPAAASGSGLSSGVITGFGSVIVNGVHHDDSKARVFDDDDSEGSRDDLKLGMVVTISGSPSVGTGTGTMSTASSITFASELKGPISSITRSGTATTGSFVVLGQTVIVGTSTVFEESLPGLGALTVTNIVEVHGLLNPATNTLQATRIELKNNANAYKLRGVVSLLNTGSKTFNLGSETVTYANIEPDKLPTLSNGLIVKVKLQTTRNTAGQWVATKVRVAKFNEDKDEAEIEGLITSPLTASRQFQINGLPVDASNARFEGFSSTATLADLTATFKVGTKVEAEGAIVNGVLVAKKVELEGREKGMNGIELHGPITSVNAGSNTFVVRGVTVNYAGNPTPVIYKNGSASNIVVGANVEVKGALASGGTSVIASTIEFK